MARISLAGAGAVVVAWLSPSMREISGVIAPLQFGLEAAFVAAVARSYKGSGCDRASWS